MPRIKANTNVHLIHFSLMRELKPRYRRAHTIVNAKTNCQSISNSHILMFIQINTYLKIKTQYSQADISPHQSHMN